MKAGPLFFAALVAAQPQRLHHRHAHRRQLVVEVVTDVVTVTAAEVTLYVDQNGHTVSTGFNSKPTTSVSLALAQLNAQALPSTTLKTTSLARPTTTSLARPTSTSTSLTHDPIFPTTLISMVLPLPTSIPAAPPVSSSSSTPAAPAPSPSNVAPPAGSASGYGLTYSPYRSDGTCKSQAEIDDDFSVIYSKGSYKIFRLYGTDCDQVARVLKATASKGTKLFLGIFDISSVEQQAATIVSAVNGDWSRIDTVSVGNELVNMGKATVGQIRTAVALAKKALIGYSGPVVTVDTFIAIINNPELCEIGDYVAANCHAFFDGNVAAADAGTFVANQAKRVSDTCGGKRTVITETGWPSRGDSNRNAIPSEQNQQAAVSSLKQNFSDDLFLFTAFNDYWKADSKDTFNAEKYWGMFGDSAAH